MLESVRKTKSEVLLVFASTNKIYGALENEPTLEKGKRVEFAKLKNGVDEDMPLDFHSPYGCSKGTADQYVRDYSRIYGLNTVVFRQSCIYGKRQFGIEDQGWVAWFTIAAAMQKPITIYGNGKQVRDILDVSDLISAFLLAEKKQKKAVGQIYNIGGGPKNTLSLLELIDFLEKKIDKKIHPMFAKVRPGDQPIYVSNISKAKKELGWEPKINIKKGLKQLIEWVKENQLEIKQVLE